MLRIGRAIIAMLNANSTINNIVGSKIYPIVAPEDVKLPFIVYKRNSITPSYTKDGMLEDEGQIQINVLSEDYSQSIDLIQAVRESIELKSGVFTGMLIKSIRMDSATELADENVYIQEVIFKIIKQ